MGLQLVIPFLARVIFRQTQRQSLVSKSTQFSPMSSSVPPRSAAGVDAPKRKISFFRNGMKNRHQFIQFFAMTGILFLSIRSLGQKYRIHDLLEDNAALRDEQKSLAERINNIKSGLYHEASLDSTGVFASKLKALFSDDQ